MDPGAAGQLSGSRAQRGRWRLALLVVGCTFAAVLTFLVSFAPVVPLTAG